MSEFTKEYLNDSLVVAAQDGDVKGVVSWLEQGADVHFAFDAALRKACKYGRYEVVKCLVDRGADVNAKDTFGNEVLLTAFKEGYLRIVELLIKNGVNVYYLTDWPVCWASEYGEFKLVKLLLEKGSKVTDDSIRAARYYGHKEVVKLLEDHIKKGRNK